MVPLRVRESRDWHAGHVLSKGRGQGLCVDVAARDSDDSGRVRLCFCVI